MWNRYVVWAFLFWLFVPPGSLWAQHAKTLRERVREDGYALGNVYGEDRYLATLEHLIRKSAIIIRGRVVNEKSRLSADEGSVLTDYTIEVLEVLKSSRQLTSVGDKLTVSKEGGNIVLEGRPVRWETPPFPPIPWIAPHVFFIGWRDVSDWPYYFPGDLGVLRLEKGRVVCDGPERNRHPATRPFCGTSQEEYIQMLKTQIAALEGAGLRQEQYH